MTKRRLLALAAILAAGACGATALAVWPRPVRAADEKRLLYVASPGIRNYVEYGGTGLLVFDIANGHRFVKRLPTFPVVVGQEPENVKGVVASALTGRIYVSTPKRLGAFDLVTEKMLWSRTYEGGCDRMALSPDGKVLYVPSFEGPHWTVVDARTGDVLGTVVTNSGAHNTIYGRDGRLAYLAGLKSPMLNVADAATRKVVKQVGPFGNAIRPFTVNGKETLAFVNVNALLGFEVGDLQTGRVLHRVEVEGYKQGPVKRHGCPSHGIGLTPDEKELWLADGANDAVHIFDATVMPPKQVASLKLRDQPGWVTFSIDGRYAYPSTGEVVDTGTRKIVATLADETGRAVQSEKLLEVVFSGGRVLRVGDQFGLGAQR
jgi:DNA-binding beta-propeller fold protein YncE